MTPKEIYAEAHFAGMKALASCTPVPMVVGSPSTPLGNDIDPSKPTYFVSDGVCGFAWVNVKPGNSKFAKWLKANGLGRTDSYYGGVTVWASEGGQSLAKKEAYAYAFAEVLNKYGIKAYANSRMD
jgi:hypothetical protein